MPPQSEVGRKELLLLHCIDAQKTEIPQVSQVLPAHHCAFSIFCYNN